MKNRQKQIVAYTMAFILISFSIMCPALSKPEPVKGEVLALTTASVIGGLLISLGVTGDIIGRLSDSQADAMQRQMELEISTEQAKQKFREAFEQAKETGAFVLDSACGVWSDLKEFVRARFPDVTQETSTQMLVQPYGNTFNVEYARSAINNYLSQYPIDNYHLKQFAIDSIFSEFAQVASQTNLWLITFQTNSSNETIFLDCFAYSGEYEYPYCMANSGNYVCDINGTKLKFTYLCNNYIVDNYHCYADYLTHSWASFVYSSANFRPASLGESVALANDYAQVYNVPADEAMTQDIITSGNTVTKEEDGTYVVAGDYVIDIANPITYPVDLTKGVVLGQDIPLEQVVPVTKPEEKEDEKENSIPITPDIPVDAEMSDVVASMPDFSVLKSLFPFCIPFDMLDAIKAIQKDAKAPKFTAEIPIPIGKKEPYIWHFEVDLEEFEELAKIMRGGFIAIYIVGLFFVTKALTSWDKGE